MKEQNNELFKEIEGMLLEQKLLEKKLNSIAKKLNVNEQQLNESRNFLLSTSQQLFANKIELLKEKKFTDDLFETANVAIVIYDIEGRIKRFNSFAEELTGYREEEVIDINWMEYFILEQDKTEMKKVFSEFLNRASGSIMNENRIICKDDTIKNIDWSYSFINNKLEESYVLGIGMNITERKKNEDVLTKERKLFSAGPVAILTWLPESGWPIKYVSSNIEKILDYTVEEMTSHDFEYASLIHADDIERVTAEVRYNKENNIDAFEQSYRLKHKNGQYRWFYDFTNFIRDEHNELIEVRGYMFDQTILKQSEHKILLQKQRLKNIIETTNLGT